MFVLCKRAMSILYTDVEDSWKFHICCGDHTFGAQTAFLAHNPSGVWLSCWVHILMYCRSKISTYMVGHKQLVCQKKNWFVEQVSQ